MATSVRREVLLPLSPEELWPALSEPDRLAEWLAPEVRIELRPGGDAAFDWPDGSRRAVVEEVDEPRRLSFRWWECGNAEGDGVAGESRVEFTLSEADGGTLLRVTETGLGDAEGTMPQIAAMLGAGRGWERALDRLRSWCPVAV